MARLSVSPPKWPFISVVLTTRDRPRLLSLALSCYRRQTYPWRELIVVDDGEHDPADEEVVADAGGRLLRLDAGTPLGDKLNGGVDSARGPLCAKMDDDDWYAPSYLETMVGALRARGARVCRPTLAFLGPFLFFDVASWEVRWAAEGSVPGATLVFAKEDWRERPFRGVSNHEDMWFLQDQMALGVAPLPVCAPEVFLAVRHGALRRERGHTWTQQWQGEDLDASLRAAPRYRSPDALLPPWALAQYRALRRDLSSAGAPAHVVP